MSRRGKQEYDSMRLACISIIGGAVIVIIAVVLDFLDRWGGALWQ